MLSNSSEDRKLGSEYLIKFYEQEIFLDDTGIAVLYDKDLNRILMTEEFSYCKHGISLGGGYIWVLFKDKYEKKDI